MKLQIGHNDSVRGSRSSFRHFRLLAGRIVSVPDPTVFRRVGLLFVFFSLIALLFGSPLEAAKVHLILLADANDLDMVGQTVNADVDNIAELFQENIPKVHLAMIRPEAARIGRDLVLQVIDELDSRPEDAIVLYYSGHGSYDERQGMYLNLSRGGPLLRSEILDRMKTKQVRLQVLITDCCHVRQDLPPEEEDKGFLMKPPPSPSTVTPLFQRLFFEVSGVVDWTASEKDSWGFIYPNSRMYTEIDGRRKMKASIFTWNFCNVFRNENQNPHGWEEIVALVKQGTGEDFRKAYPRGYAARGKTQRDQVPEARVFLQDSASPDRRAGEQMTKAPPATRIRFGVRAANIPGREGVVVTQIRDAHPGKAARLRIGDVIVNINDHSIRNEDDYRRAVTDSPREMRFLVEGADGNLFEGKVLLND